MVPLAVCRQASVSGEEALTDDPEAAESLHRSIQRELSRPLKGSQMRMCLDERLPPSEGRWQGAQSPKGFAELCPPGPVLG